MNPAQIFQMNNCALHYSNSACISKLSSKDKSFKMKHFSLNRHDKNLQGRREEQENKQLIKHLK